MRRELTVLVALVAVGGLAYLVLAGAVEDGRAFLPGDRRAFSVARALDFRPAEQALTVLTDLGSLPVAGLLTLATAAWAAVRRRALDGAALMAGLALTWLAVHTAKAAEARPRPADPAVDTLGFAFPSGHAAYGVALVACAVVLVRGGSSLAVRRGALILALVAMTGIALSRVYLRAHYLSDVVGGVALGVAIFSAAGIVAVVIAFVRQNPGS